MSSWNVQTGCKTSPFLFALLFLTEITVRGIKVARLARDDNNTIYYKVILDFESVPTGSKLSKLSDLPEHLQNLELFFFAKTSQNLLSKQGGYSLPCRFRPSNIEVVSASKGFVRKVVICEISAFGGRQEKHLAFMLQTVRGVGLAHGIVDHMYCKYWGSVSENPYVVMYPIMTIRG